MMQETTTKTKHQANNSENDSKQNTTTDNTITLNIPPKKEETNAYLIKQNFLSSMEMNTKDDSILHHLVPSVNHAAVEHFMEYKRKSESLHGNRNTETSSLQEFSSQLSSKIKDDVLDPLLKQILDQPSKSLLKQMLYYDSDYFQHFKLYRTGNIRSKKREKKVVYELLDYRTSLESLLRTAISKSNGFNQMSLRYILQNKSNYFNCWEEYIVKMIAEIIANSYPNFASPKKLDPEPLNNPKIDRKTRLHIGKGVSKVKLNGKEVAEKVTHHQDLAMNELEIFEKINSLSNEGTVELLHHYTDDSGSTHLFLELMDCSLDNCPLTDFSIDHFGKLIQILFICLKIVETMNTLHKDNVIHYDIKPANILIRFIEVDGLKLVKDVKIADFDVSLCVDKIETYSATVSGTAQYMAPELILKRDNKLPSDFKFVYPALDVYSFGVTIFELFSGKHVQKYERVEAFLSEKYLLEMFPCFTEDQVKKLVIIGNSCLHTEPSQRPTFETIQQQLLEITASLFCSFREKLNSQQ